MERVHTHTHTLTLRHIHICMHRGHIAMHCNSRRDENTHSLNYSIFKYTLSRSRSLALWKTAERVQQLIIVHTHIFPFMTYEFQVLISILICVLRDKNTTITATPTMIDSQPTLDTIKSDYI